MIDIQGLFVEQMKEKKKRGWGAKFDEVWGPSPGTRDGVTFRGSMCV